MTPLQTGMLFNLFVPSLWMSRSIFCCTSVAKGFFMTLIPLALGRSLKPALLSLVMAAAFLPTAQAQSQTSEFDKSAPDFDSVQAPVQMNEIEIKKAILESLKRECDSEGKCWLIGTDCKGSSWQFGGSAGVGSRNYSNGTGTIINLGQETNDNGNDPYYSLSFGYRHQTQETNLRVSRPLKVLFETYQWAGVNPDGSTKRTFSPADLAMLSFYATIVGKLETCRVNGQQ
jgi:hypothetical protein